MTRRRSPGFYRLIGLIGTNRIVSRLHPVVHRATGGRWIVGRDLGVLNVVVETVGRRSGKVREIPLYASWTSRRIPVIVLEPVATQGAA